MSAAIRLAYHVIIIMMVHWLVLMCHRKTVLDLILCEVVCSPRVLMGSLLVLWLPPTFTQCQLG